MVIYMFNRWRKIDEKYEEIKSKLIEVEKQLSNMNKRKTKVLITGFYGAPNLGDELMLETILERLLINKNLELTVMICENVWFDITNYPAVKIIRYPEKILDINTLAEEYDYFIFGGGALLDDYDYNPNYSPLSLGYTLINLSMRAIQYNKKTILYGLSTTNEFNNEEYLKKLNFIIKNCTYISLRDTNSLETLKKYNIDTSKIKVVNDIVISNKRLLNKVNKKSNLISIFYVCSDKLYDNILSLTNRLHDRIKDSDYILNLVPYYSYKEHDYKFYERLKNDLNYENIIINKVPVKMNDIVDLINDSKVVISMRYHISLIANFLGKSNIAILYEQHRHYPNKVNYIYDNYKFEKNLVTFDNEKIIEMFDNVLNKKNKPKNVEKIVMEANDEINEMLNVIDSVGDLNEN